MPVEAPDGTIAPRNDQLAYVCFIRRRVFGVLTVQTGLSNNIDLNQMLVSTTHIYVFEMKIAWTNLDGGVTTRIVHRTSVDLGDRHVCGFWFL